MDDTMAGMDLKDSERVKKLYRQIQRKVHCSREIQEALTVEFVVLSLLLDGVKNIIPKPTNLRKFT